MMAANEIVADEIAVDESADEVRIGVDEVVRHFEGLEDPRSHINRHHPLSSVVTIAVMAVLCGCDGPQPAIRASGPTGSRIVGVDTPRQCGRKSL